MAGIARRCDEREDSLPEDCEWPCGSFIEGVAQRSAGVKSLVESVEPEPASSHPVRDDQDLAGHQAVLVVPRSDCGLIAQPLKRVLEGRGAVLARRKNHEREFAIA